MSSELVWQYQVHVDGDRTRVVLAGEIDMDAAPQLRDLLQVAVRSASTVEVDAAKLSFIDSTAISAFIAARNTSMNTGCRFAVVNPSRQVRRILDVTNLLGVLTADAS